MLLNLSLHVQDWKSRVSQACESGSAGGSLSYCRDIEGSPDWERLRVKSGRLNASTEIEISYCEPPTTTGAKDIPGSIWRALQPCSGISSSRLHYLLPHELGEHACREDCIRDS